VFPQVGGQVEPLKVVKALPDDMVIPNLRQRLIALMRRFRTTVHLKKLCNSIIDADCMTTAERLMKRRQEPLRHIHMWDGQRGVWELYDSATGKCVPCDPPVVPPHAVTFRPPTHTHKLSMRTQVAAHIGAALDALQPRGGGTLNIDGMHALVDQEVQQLVRQEIVNVQQAASGAGGLTIWTTDE
jgi:hypothetical protein